MRRRSASRHPGLPLGEASRPGCGVAAGGCRERHGARRAADAIRAWKPPRSRRGIVADPANTDPTGLYARDRDRICVVPSATAFRIGIYVDYGDDYFCSG